MAFWRRRERGLRLFFATDLHGSTLAFRKFLSAPRFYEADLLVLGGDLTGKRLIRVGRDGDSAELREKAETEGAYLWEVGRDEPRPGGSDAEFEHSVFTALAADRIRQWLAKAEDVLSQTQTPCYVIAGNDDPPLIADVLNQHQGPLVRHCESRVLEAAGGHQVAGLGMSNPTPWHTPRETSEEELAQHLERLAALCPDGSRLIADVHVPPHGLLDSCALLDGSVSPPRPLMSGGQPVMGSVGSTAVRDYLQRTQPLLALCGHVHEEHGALRLGRTLVVNPGSEYGDGTLRGALIQFGEGNLNFQLTSG
jgi:Icc-related predicted phosphoesterase